jgi:voltage-gated potassium channel
VSPARLIDRHWLRATLATLVLVGLVAAALGADLPVALGSLAICGLGFGFFYLLFPGGSHFGVTMANALAVYACLFVFFRDANFAAASEIASTIGLALPVVAFLGGCFWRRRRIASSIAARRREQAVHLPRMDRWLPAIILVGAASFALPLLNLPAAHQDAALLGAMALIGAAAALAAREVVVLLIEIAMVFEGVTARLDRLLMPVMAFLTFYSLLVVVFACFYRIADLTNGVPQFLVSGQPVHLGFGDALYFSVITIATVGYGDITPSGPLVRGLAAVEVVLGLLLLLFGFSEIMRTRSPDKR